MPSADSPEYLHPGCPAAADWTKGDELGTVERIMLLERDAALASSIRAAALHAGSGSNVVGVMGALTADPRFAGAVVDSASGVLGLTPVAC